MQKSLYPYVMRSKELPVGRPEVLTRETILEQSPVPWTKPEQCKWKGVIQAQVLPPTNLRYPVLGYKTDRLCFTLCARCAERNQQTPCRHRTKERAWITTTTHVELQKALSKAYQVLDVYQIDSYKEWAGGGEGNLPSLFAGYIDAFFKLKVGSSHLLSLFSI